MILSSYYFQLQLQKYDMKTCIYCEFEGAEHLYFEKFNIPLKNFFLKI